MNKKTTRIETDDWTQVRKGDVIAFKFHQVLGEMAGVPVKGRSRPYISMESITEDGRTNRTYIDGLSKVAELVGITRAEKSSQTKYRPRFKELDFTRVPVKPGSRASIDHALESVEYIFGHFDSRLKDGQLLLDQWEGDAYESSKDAIIHLQKLLKAIS